MVQGSTDKVNVVLFDGRCGLCRSIVRFLVKRDRGSLFTFIPLDEAERNLSLYRKRIFQNEPDTIVLICHPGSQNETVHVRSDAVLKIFGLLGGFWQTLLVLRFFPAGFRNLIYNWVSRHRTSLSGPDACCTVIPPP